MGANLIALYRRPEGGDEAQATFWQRYRDEHMPLIEKVPGLQGTKIWNVSRRYVGDDDLMAVVEMHFADMDALKAGMRSEEMQAAGATISDIAPGLMTLVALEESQE